MKILSEIKDEVAKEHGYEEGGSYSYNVIDKDSILNLIKELK